jgi:hydrogenase maturation protein HypF
MGTPLDPTTIARSRIEVRGIVQGVGFRPFVYRLAQELALAGFVHNDGAGVTIEVEGDSTRIEMLARRLADDPPPRARVDAVVLRACAPRAEVGFVILESQRGRARTAIGPDTAICDACLRELFDPTDRRYRYAFINCTHCGPRYTITRALPYDRAMTSMAAFEQCPECLAEYTSPAHRRFHAEPNACPRCGPALELVDGRGVPLAADDPIAGAVARLRSGEIVAIKGLGGFHLACDARNAEAVAALRRRKSREEKPFAVMVANAASLTPYAFASAAEDRLLSSPERPIVLLRKRAAVDDRLPGVGAGLAWLGAMLPYTPLQYLLFHEAAGRPPATAWIGAPQDLILVMTSANPGGEPLVIDNAEALTRLNRIADAFLVHDRAIFTRCDDSVLRAGADAAGRAFQFVRRARGYTPRAIKLARPGPVVVALGGYFKNTVCVTRGDEAFVSQHIGDLDNAPTCEAHVEAIEHLTSILEVEPELVAHDLHPDFFSTRHAAALAERHGVACVGVQHHHAHIAAVVAEHRVEGPVLGVALDGVGLGLDGKAWGGELLRVEGPDCVRIGHLAPLRLPGGDIAAREPWRMAASALALCGRSDEIVRRYGDERAAGMVEVLLERNLQSPTTTGMGRYFDAAAGLLGVKRRMAFEGQAAMLVEGLAERHGAASADRSLYAFGEGNVLELCELLASLADEGDAQRGAARFHATLGAALADWIARTAERTGLRTIACGGGCFLNAIVARELRCALEACGLTMLEAAAVPPNDGGLSLGQAWVALQASMER